ncbi:hypothetical protein AYI69_g7446 [Smittium culicis]|uniref:Uncharacterized protein n=1 Tax=Smittium culicis TaxID=133412 RepID=A0A1R1XS16_9FUNG|nr:hypothetical protein AYI69_g7446 [Smittium culicis]
MAINASKCNFGVSKVEIVGFICSEEGRKREKVLPNKERAVRYDENFKKNAYVPIWSKIPSRDRLSSSYWPDK